MTGKFLRCLLLSYHHPCLKLAQRTVWRPAAPASGAGLSHRNPSPFHFTVRICALSFLGDCFTPSTACGQQSENNHQPILVNSVSPISTPPIQRYNISFSGNPQIRKSFITQLALTVHGRSTIYTSDPCSPQHDTCLAPDCKSNAKLSYINCATTRCHSCSSHSSSSTCRCL